MAPTPVRNFRLPLALLERIDAARGVESRTSWLIRAAEAFMEPDDVVEAPDPRVLAALAADAATAALPVAVARR